MVDTATHVHFVRTRAVVSAGLHAALAFPIRNEAGVTAILAFFSRDVYQPDPDLLQMMADIGRQIAQFAERRQAEEALRRSEEQLRQSQKMEAVGQLAGGIAHDFNNLLTIIVSRSEILLETLGSGHPGARDADIVRRAAARSAALTQQLLAFSRKQVLQPRILDLNAIGTNLSAMLQRLIGEHIELRWALAPELGRVKADPGQIEQVIMNLAVNARDAMPQGGRLTIETVNVSVDAEFVRQHPGARAGEFVALRVHDTGTGMDEETLSHLFEPFFTTKGVGKGTGLGLSTVYGIVKQHNGNIFIDSKPGHGSTFRIYLPRVDEPLDEEASEIPSPKQSRGSATLLVVEDDADVRELTCQILEACGHTVLRAASAEEALRVSAAHAGLIDLLLTDVVMPHLSGPRLAERLLAQRPGMRVLYISGYTDNAIVYHGALSTGTAFLPKPFTPASLAQKVSEVLAPPDSA